LSLQFKTGQDIHCYLLPEGLLQEGSAVLPRILKQETKGKSVL
jgi:hypothetical protein